MAGIVPPKKLYIFLNCFTLTGADRAAIAKQCAGKTCVFLYANGLINKTVEARNMEEILGVPLTMVTVKMSGQCQPVTHALTQNVPIFGVDELAPVITLDAKRDAANKAEVLATYTANGQPAAWKHPGEYTAIYIGALTAPAALLRNIATAAGVHVYTTGDDVIEADERFVAIHAGSPGDKVIRLPRRARVHEALTGATVGNSIETWSVEMNKGDTRLYSVDYGRPGPGE